MKQLLVFFKKDYNHPKARPEDPCRFIPMLDRYVKLMNGLTVFGFLGFMACLGILYFFKSDYQTLIGGIEIPNRPSVPSWILFFLVSPLIGLLIIFKGLNDASMKLARLRNGIVVQSIIKSKKRIDFEDETIPNFVINVEFATQDRNIVETIINESHNKINNVIAVGLVVYLPWDPSNAIFLKSLSEYEIRILT